MTKRYPTAAEHEKNWQELAEGIASIKDQIARATKDSKAEANSKVGSLTILGTGIETIGVSIGDKMLIEEADKVLYCVADPITVTWLNKLRPDALDLYVLYGEDKARYLTYMQMTEAVLYWVRKGLNVVCLFYGHPGIFVLSTHRAISIARREGYEAIMKAGVCALDTLCADLGVDPCNPGLQTYEATEALIRQRVIDTTANVVLWQVGLIGEGGYRRLGFLNNNFSFFINWLQGIYGEDYEVTHYIGSRYPTIDPIIEVYKLSELHNPSIQSNINGLSTLYIPPKDIVKTDRDVCLALGMIRSGQDILPSKSPLREIDKYTWREIKAFDAFANFKIPYSYKFQNETEASKFVMTLKFDLELQRTYKKDPYLAFKDTRFKKLSDREKFLLSSKDGRAVQVAAKGLHIKHLGTEQFVRDLLCDKNLCTELAKVTATCHRGNIYERLCQVTAEYKYDIDWKELRKCFDVIIQANLFPWTGVYIVENKELIITLIGGVDSIKNSLLYINNIRVKSFSYRQGVLKWESNIFKGFLKLDISIKGKRRIIGKIWRAHEKIPNESNFIAYEVDLQKANLYRLISNLQNQLLSNTMQGEYTVRTTGKYRKTLNNFKITLDAFFINGNKIQNYTLTKNTLSWINGDRECFEGEVKFIIDPILSTVELFGKSREKDNSTFVKCYGSALELKLNYTGPNIPNWASQQLIDIINENISKGGLMLWYKWEKHQFITKFVDKLISSF